jgi:hypothetical protein
MHFGGLKKVAIFSTANEMESIQVRSINGLKL